MNTLSLVQAQPYLARFTTPEDSPCQEGRLSGLLVAATAVAMILGGVLMLVEVPELRLTGNDDARRVRIQLETVAVPRPDDPEVQASLEPVEIPRLEPETILAAPVDRPADPQPEPAVSTPQVISEPPPAAATPPRRIYGVRKVYAKGLGVTGHSSGGLVTSRGNTLAGVRDTLTATEADLRGELAGLSTVDSAPEPLHRIKPAYSAAMRKARARGVVSANLLIDSDGRVADVEITADIGLDSREVAEEALRRFRFRPARKNGKPVAVWIRHRIRFEFQE